MKSTHIKNYQYILQLLAALYLAWFTAHQVLAFNFKLLIFILAGILFLIFFSLEKRFIVFSLAAFFPIMLQGKLGPINLPKAIELIAPIFCFLLIIEIVKNKQSFYSRKAFIYFVAIGVIALWSLISFIKRPLVGQAFGGGTEGGLRAYITIFIGITTFLSSFWFFRYKELNAKRWLILIMVVSLLLGYLQLIGFFAHFKIPFLGSVFNIHIDTTRELVAKYYRYSFYRIGGLDYMALLTITCLLTLFYRKKWNLFSIFVFISCIVFLYFSGGRTMSLVVTFLILVYFSWLKRNYVVIASVLIIASILFSVLPNIKLEGQIERILAYKGGFEEQDKSRADFYRYYLEIFTENPLFGKGLGFTKSEIVDMKESKRGFKKKRFIEEQIALGGHGSYLSMLSLYGIGGILFIFVMLYGSMYYAYRIFKKSREFQDDAVLAFFVFLYLLTLSIRFITGGNGYSSMPLWFIAGLVAGLRAKQGEKIIEIQ
jgi:O-antigen ligase